MKVLRSFVSIALAAGLSAPVVYAQAHSPQLDAVLKKLNTAAANFRGVEADVSNDTYERVVRDHSFDVGSTYVKRSKKSLTMGVILFNLGPDNKPLKTPAKIIAYDGNVLQYYVPGTGEYQVLKAGANRAKYEVFLALAFGSSGDDLEKSWTIQDMGSEDVIDGTQTVKTEKLDLVSKDASVRNWYTHVTIWVDPVRGVTLKQIFYAPSGDSRTTTYSNIRLKKDIDTRPYEISKDAHRIVR